MMDLLEQFDEIAEELDTTHPLDWSLPQWLFAAGIATLIGLQFFVIGVLCLSATPVQWPEIQCPGQPCNCMAPHWPDNPAHEFAGCWLGSVAIWDNNGRVRCE